MYNRYTEILKQLEQDNNLRKIPGALPEGSINLSSNDYLGLSNNKGLQREFFNYIALSDLKFSASSSRLLTGNSREYEQLENTIANAYNREACLVYNSGYHANIGILPSLASKKDLILADKLVHASIIDGIKLSKAETLRYNHLDYNHLENILKKKRKHHEQVFIVTESIFSMDGDIADLETLVHIKEKYNCFIYIDEAHALGVRGKKGLGCAEELGLINACDFIVGTFGKAIASIGAFVVCNNNIKEYLVNTSRSLIFTTALPPVNLAWTNFIFEKLPTLTPQREKLNHVSKVLSENLEIKHQSHIIPFITGSNESAIALSKEMINQGFYVLPIRYPTVPKGKARLRFSLNAALTTEDIQQVTKILEQYEYTLAQ